jgi:hypothetical protein
MLKAILEKYPDRYLVHISVDQTYNREEMVEEFGVDWDKECCMINFDLAVGE